MTVNRRSKQKSSTNEGEEHKKHAERMKSDRRRIPRRSCEIVQIFVKAEVGKTLALGVTLRGKAKDVKHEMFCSTDVVYVSFEGDEMRACGVEDGCTVKVRGGDLHKNEQFSEQKKRQSRDQHVQEQAIEIPRER